jgi:hypothetical protein
MISHDDSELLAALKKVAADNGHSPSAFIQLAKGTAEHQRRAYIPNVGPFPRVVEEVAITSNALGAWPAWVPGLVPPGSQREKLHWPDDSTTLRLVDPRGLVLAAKWLPIQTPTKTP